MIYPKRIAGQCAPTKSPSDGNGQAHANGKPAANGKPKPDDHLTPEESARKFDILEGIRAIPVEDMPGCLKPLAQSWMSHAGYGQGVSYASYDTLGRETGCRGRYVRDLARKLLKAEWFVSRGRRDGQSKHCRPEITPGPRMVVYLRSYFAEVDGRYVNPVDGRYVNKPGSSSGPKNRDDEPPGRPDVRPETAPSVPAGKKSGGKGPPPLSPSASTHEESLAAHDPLYLRRIIVEGWVRDALSTFAGDFEQARIKLMCQHGGDPINRQLIEDAIAKRKRKEA